MSYTDIQMQVIARYNVLLDENSKCWGRTHAHIRERRICKWHPKNSIQSTFTLLHEIGHLETTTSKMRRCEEEYFATVWALERCKEYGLQVPGNIIQKYQRYIDMEYDRGVRRGGKFAPINVFQLRRAI